jgi:hypothetical protein
MTRKPDKDLPQTWEVVFRRGEPIAAFLIHGLASEWTKSAPHRKKDTIAKRKITFLGIDGYERIP